MMGFMTSQEHGFTEYFLFLFFETAIFSSFFFSLKYLSSFSQICSQIDGKLYVIF